MELKQRSEFPENELWDLSALYQDREDFLRSIEKTIEDINLFKKNYQDNLKNCWWFHACALWSRTNLYRNEPYR